MIKTSCLSAFSTNQVFSNEEMLIEIFLRLPGKSLVRCKCVSKKWNYLITSPEFTSLRVPHFNPAIGLLLHCSSFLINPFHEFVSFSPENPIQSPFHKLTFVDDPFGIRILQSCNGLLLCCSFRVHGQHNQNYYVYNPTTQQFTTLPRPEGQRNTSRAVIGMKLAFDPWKSQNYKVVCIRLSDEVFPDYQHYQIEIYSSDTKKWRVLGPPFLARYDIGFTHTGVYWNGAIYWIYGDNPLRFNVEQEKLEKFPMPCIGRSWDDDQEMKSDGTEWYLKYQVNVEDVINTFAHMIRHYLEPTDWNYFAMVVLCVVRGEKEEDTFMILHIPKMIIRYNLRDYTFYKLCESGNTSIEETRFDDEDEDYEPPITLAFDKFSAFQYIETLFCL
ncbi:hypothetical protein FXO38_28544 [Capsicum annuum]|nr:hypothetical protein FXO37_35626 [Capsicum annuum]KAF3627870.1 hypothetical protein FXO38_28544 [Capsicum annuum]